MFKWEKISEEDTLKTETKEYDLDDIYTNCSFCNVHNPGCTKRKSDKHLKLCWDIMNEMRFVSDNLFRYNDKIYYLVECKKCKYPYIVVDDQEFVCEECE